MLPLCHRGPFIYSVESDVKTQINDPLTMRQWIVGFGGSMRNQNSKDAMLDYLICLLDSSNEFSK